MESRFRLAHAAVLVVMSIALTGCAEVAEPDSTPAAKDDPSAPDAAEPVAANVSLQSHAHDYWQERERVTLLEDEVVIEPLDTVEWGVMTTLVLRDTSFGGAFIDLPEGILVYEGTGRLEIVATWSDPTITGLRFLHRHAGSGDVNPWIVAPNGETISLDVSPEMTDMPHAQASRWGFLFAASGAPPLATGTFHLRIDIVKTRDVAEWPAHPDHWNGRDELTLAQADGSSAQHVGPRMLDDPFAEPEGAIHSTAIVPMEAAILRVVVTVLSTQDLAGASELHFRLRTASNIQSDFNHAGDPIEVSADGLTWTWEVPIAMEQTDNPYAETSAWAFLVRAGPEGAPDAPL